MDVVTSPASSANGAVNPSLLARRISVSRAIGNFHDQRRVAVLDDAELPRDRLAVVGLHEPAESGAKRLAVGERLRQRLHACGRRKEAVVVRQIELREIERARDDALREVETGCA